MTVRLVVSWARRTPPAFIGGAEVAVWRLVQRVAAVGGDVVVIGSATWPWLRGTVPSRAYKWRNVSCLAAATERERLAATARACAESRSAVLMSCLEGAPATFEAVAGLPHVRCVHWVHSLHLPEPVSGGGIEHLFASTFLAHHHRHHDDDVLVPLAGHDYCTSSTKPTTSVVLFVNPIESKGWSTVIAVATKLTDVTFRVHAGWYDDPPSSLPSNVSYFPRTQLDNCFYNNVSVAIMPSLVAEGYGLVAAEALVHGIPVVATDIGGAREVAPIEMRLAGADPGDWADAIMAQLDDPDSLAIAQAARLVRAREEGSLARFASRFTLRCATPARPVTPPG